jgi:DNA-binding transcriptional LysR family regulator
VVSPKTGLLSRRRYHGAALRRIGRSDENAGGSAAGLACSAMVRKLSAIAASSGRRCAPYLPEDQVLSLVEKGTLRRVLKDWCPPFHGYHLYYPSRRQHSSGFAVLIDALRYHGG